MSRPKRRRTPPATPLALPVECATCHHDGRWVPGDPEVHHDRPRRVCLVRLPERVPTGRPVEAA